MGKPGLLVLFVLRSPPGGKGCCIQQGMVYTAGTHCVEEKELVCIWVKESNCPHWGPRHLGHLPCSLGSTPPMPYPRVGTFGFATALAAAPGRDGRGAGHRVGGGQGPLNPVSFVGGECSSVWCYSPATVKESSSFSRVPRHGWGQMGVSSPL